MPADNNRILIVDGTEERGNALFSQLRDRGGDVAYLRFPRHQPKLNPDTAGSHKEWALALIHADDIQSLLKWERENAINIRSKVYYGGTGGFDPRIPAGAFRIWKVMLGAEDLLSAKECVDFLELARNAEFLPAILEPRAKLPVLRVLAVLTVVYMAVRASKTVGIMGPDHVKGVPDSEIQCFKTLGWFRMAIPLRRRLINQPDALPSYDEKVSDSEWWVEQLEIAGGTNWRDEVKQELKRAEARGLREANAVEELIKELVDVGTSRKLLPPKVINAYSALAGLVEW